MKLIIRQQILQKRKRILHFYRMLKLQISKYGDASPVFSFPSINTEVENASEASPYLEKKIFTHNIRL